MGLLYSKFDARNTNRQETLSGYSGNAGPSVVKKPEKYSNYAPEVVHKQNLPSSGPRNAQIQHLKILQYNIVLN